MKKKIGEPVPNLLVYFKDIKSAFGHSGHLLQRLLRYELAPNVSTHIQQDWIYHNSWDTICRIKPDELVYELNSVCKVFVFVPFCLCDFGGFNYFCELVASKVIHPRLD